MADIDLNNTSTDTLAQQNTQSEAERRIKELSDKVRLTSIERDEKDTLLKASGEKIATLEKENTFNSGYAEMLGSYPGAKDHKDDIKAKVLSGYTVEDATLAVLGKAGKLGAQSQQQQQVAGGSADTNITNASKEVKDMNQSERRAALAEQLQWS